MDLTEHFQRREACYFVSHTLKDEEGRFILCIAIRNEVGYLLTEQRVGKDERIAKEIVHKKNKQYRVSERLALDIIQSSVALQDEMDDLIDDIEYGR
jgi:hypothetical protein